MRSGLPENVFLFILSPIVLLNLLLTFLGVNQEVDYLIIDGYHNCHIIWFHSISYLCTNDFSLIDLSVSLMFPMLSHWIDFSSIWIHWIADQLTKAVIVTFTTAQVFSLAFTAERFTDGLKFSCTNFKYSIRWRWASYFSVGEVAYKNKMTKTYAYMVQIVKMWNISPF